MTDLFWDIISSPVAYVYVCADDHGVVRMITLHESPKVPDNLLVQRETAGRRNLTHGPRRDSKRMKPIMDELKAYFLGEKKVFDLPVDYGPVPPFHSRVLDVTQKIPYGQTMTYSQVAAAAGSPLAARAAGGALAKNPIAIVIPCHRVVAANGALTGYSAFGGVDTKKWLLNHETGRSFH